MTEEPFIMAKICNIIFRKRGGAGGQRPFGTFLKKHPFWWVHPSLTSKTFHHHHVGDYDYVEDIDEEVYDFDDTVDGYDDPGVTLVMLIQISDIEVWWLIILQSVILSSAMTLTFICALFHSAIIIFSV